MSQEFLARIVAIKRLFLICAGNRFFSKGFPSKCYQLFSCNICRNYPLNVFCSKSIVFEINLACFKHIPFVVYCEDFYLKLRLWKCIICWRNRVMIVPTLISNKNEDALFKKYLRKGGLRRVRKPKSSRVAWLFSLRGPQTIDVGASNFAVLLLSAFHRLWESLTRTVRYFVLCNK